MGRRYSLWHSINSEECLLLQMNVFREPRVILTPECASCQYVFPPRVAQTRALFSHPPSSRARSRADLIGEVRSSAIQKIRTKSFRQNPKPTSNVFLSLSSTIVEKRRDAVEYVVNNRRWLEHSVFAKLRMFANVRWFSSRRFSSRTMDAFWRRFIG